MSIGVIKHAIRARQELQRRDRHQPEAGFGGWVVVRLKADVQEDEVNTVHQPLVPPEIEGDFCFRDNVPTIICI